MRLLVTFVALLLLCGAVSCNKSSPDAKEPFSFTGKVTDSSGNPLKGASISVKATQLTFVVDPWQDLGTTATSSGGNYSIVPVIPNLFDSTYTYHDLFYITASYQSHSSAVSITLDSIEKTNQASYEFDFVL